MSDTDDKAKWLIAAQRSDVLQLNDVGLPERYQGLSIRGIKTPVLQKVAQEYLSKFWELAPAGKAPALLGQAGAYKTYTAAVITWAVSREALIDAAFVQCGPEFQRLERQRFDIATERRVSYLERVPFLVLDDFTKLKPGSFGLDMMDALVEKRYASGFPTMYTGNIVISLNSDAALVDHFGVGFARRLQETSRGLIAVAKPSKE